MATKKIKLNIKSKDSDDTSTPPPPPLDSYESSGDEGEKEAQSDIPKSPSATPPSSMQTPPELLKEMDEKEKLAMDEHTTPDTPPEILKQLDEQKKSKSIEKKKRESNKKRDIFIPIIGETNITLPLKSVGKNLKEKISKNLAIKLEGKCTGDGFVKSDSLKITTYSNGLLVEGNIKYKVIYEAYVCNPVEGHVVECTVNNVTKAGIRATVSDGDDTPLVIFIARDHHYNDSYFLSVREGDNINVRVIGTRYELNDTYIAIIGELVKQKKPRITIKK
jgi:DNA-directed RNA polymerase subunit E'/Rpb7